MALVSSAVSILLWTIWPWRDFAILGGTVLLFAWLLKTGGRSPEETKRIGAIIVLFVFATLFWVAFEQAGSSLTLFADQNTDNVVLRLRVPLQLVPVGGAGLRGALRPRVRLALGLAGPARAVEPRQVLLGPPARGSGFRARRPGAAARFAASGQKVSPWWLIGLYFCHALGELALSPVGLSTVTKLAPARIVGLMMGVWFLALSLGNFLGGRVAGLFGQLPLPQLFGGVFLATAVAALLLAFLAKPIKGLMGGVR